MFVTNPSADRRPYDAELRAQLSQAQARAANPIQDLSVQLPPQWGSVLLVSYRPKQVVSAPGKATRIRF